MEHIRELVDRLRQHDATIAVAESCTGGLIATSISATDGAGECFLGGVVAYDREVKEKLLRVNVADGVITPRAAEEMAVGVRRLLDADVGLATTGVVGPDREEGHPVGTVWVGIAVGPERATSHCVRIDATDPDAVRAAASRAAVELLAAELAATSSV